LSNAGKTRRRVEINSQTYPLFREGFRVLHRYAMLHLR